jgi:hypothetical protein
MDAVHGLHPCAQGLSSPAMPVPALAGQKAPSPRRLVAKAKAVGGFLDSGLMGFSAAPVLFDLGAFSSPETKNFQRRESIFLSGFTHSGQLFLLRQLTKNTQFDSGKLLNSLLSSYIII